MQLRVGVKSECQIQTKNSPALKGRHEKENGTVLCFDIVFTALYETKTIKKKRYTGHMTSHHGCWMRMQLHGSEGVHAGLMHVAVSLIISARVISSGKHRG